MKMKKYQTVKAMLSDLTSDDKKLVEEVDAAYDREKITNHLFILRNRAGVSQVEMAKRLGVTQSTISKMENNADSLSFNAAIRYCHVLGFSVELAFIQGGRSVDFLGSYFSRIKRGRGYNRSVSPYPPRTTGICREYTQSQSKRRSSFPKRQERRKRFVGSRR